MGFIRTLSLQLRWCQFQCQRLSTLHISLPIFHTSFAPLPFAGRLAERLRPAFPAVDGYLAPGPASESDGWAVGTGLSAFGIGRPAFPAVDGFLAGTRPWPRLRVRWLGTGLSAFGIGRPAFPVVDDYLAPGPPP